MFLNCFLRIGFATNFSFHIATVDRYVMFIVDSLTNLEPLDGLSVLFRRNSQTICCRIRVQTSEWVG